MKLFNPQTRKGKTAEKQLGHKIKSRNTIHRSPHYFIIILSIMACMSFTLTMPLLPFFILSYMDS